MTAYSAHAPVTSDLFSGFDRIRVDPAQTSFFEGREFRSFKELNIAIGATYVIKVVVGINTIVNSIQADLDAGWLRLGTYVGGAEGGVFSETLSIIGANTMQNGANHRATYGSNKNLAYTATNIATAGGTHTGGTELDVIRVKCAGNSNQASSVGNSAFDERGVPSGTYYFRLLNLGNDVITGVFKIRWEERA